MFRKSLRIKATHAAKLFFVPTGEDVGCFRKLTLQRYPTAFVACCFVHARLNENNDYRYLGSGDQGIDSGFFVFSK